MSEGEYISVNNVESAIKSLHIPDSFKLLQILKKPGWKKITVDELDDAFVSAKLNADEIEKITQRLRLH